MKRIYLLILILALIIIGLISCSSRLNPNNDNSNGANANNSPTKNILDNMNGASDKDNSTDNSANDSPSVYSGESENNPSTVNIIGEEHSSDKDNAQNNTVNVPTTFLERVAGATYQGGGYTYKFSEDGKTITCEENGKTYTIEWYDNDSAVYRAARLVYWGLRLDKDGVLYWTSTSWASVSTTPSSLAASSPAYRQDNK